MEKVIYDAGYGNLAPEDFVKKLKDAGVTVVLDVRRVGSLGRLRCYDWGARINVLLAVEDIGYNSWAAFGNFFDNLLIYEGWLYSRRGGEITALARRVGMHGGAVFCLICACGDVFEKDGVTPRCHRYYVGAAVAKELGDDWKVRHI